jgi:hypothetical protein
MGLAGAGLEVTGAAEEEAAAEGPGDAGVSAGDEHPAAMTASTASTSAG